ncbi:Mu transposase C-terminal domain-containing protein [Citrobacter portucalensis]|uniref:Mu transposase C-terminal domain-containing protein n=1 Tax=Citrobacter portucalensis TaxID=1639133 RepID=UPI00226BA642|nr:Mu transposase C-terminal domain-containing protein [Citrobacter portucalensis]MCX9039353.1 Mu transposase C-terminal domain-containing protein [Citrobacter portucalensis]
MFFSAKELTGTPGLPITEKGIRQALNRFSSGSKELVRKRLGSKAFEYHIDCLPEQVREVVKERHYREAMKHSVCTETEAKPARREVTTTRDELQLLRQCPALLEREISTLTDRQKQIADARALLASEIERLRDIGMSRASAVAFVAKESRKGTLPVPIQAAADIANARKGSSRTGIGERSLQEWLSVYLSTKPGVERLALLAPGHLKAKKPEQIKWLPDFLAHWRKLSGPSLTDAWASFRDEWHQIYAGQPAMLAVCPSYDAVRRAMEKLPKRERVRGRVSGSARLAYEVYQKRDWSMMPVNGCWIADGKSLDMKVAHPVHGRPFTPELTLVIDGRTRYLVGWSLALSENVIAVADAYRYGMKFHGKPLFVYSDNGGGETNKTLDADITGIFSRMGIEHPTSIPGRPQSRGIIERLNAVIPRAIANKFDTYNGFGADREHVRMTGRAIHSAVKAQENGRDLTPVQLSALRKLPSWQMLLDVIAVEVDKYNNQHEHSELPKRNGRHMTPAQYRSEVMATEGDDIEYLTDIELREAFMPEMRRTAQRGWIGLMNNEYFSADLIQVDGEEVRVAYDIHDPSSVIVRRMDGTYVCTAIWNGNKRAALPVSAMDIAVEQRHQRRLKRIEEQREEIEAEARGLLPESSMYPDFGALIPAEYERITDEREPVFLFESERDEWLKSQGNKKAAF